MAVVAFVFWCGWLSLVDLRERRLPNLATGLGAVGVLAYAALTGRFGAAAIGGALLAGCYLVVHLAAPQALGAGDVKLAAGLGAVAGLAGGSVWVLAAILAPLLTAIVGSVALIRRRAGPIPHGPAMCAATLLALAVSG